MSEYQSLLAKILIGDFLGPISAVNSLPLQNVVVDVLFRNGRLPLHGITRQARLSEKVVSETLTALIQHGFVRWVTVEEGPVERTYYESFFEDIYPLLRYGIEIHLVEKHTGSPEAASLVKYIMMQGRQKIKDLIAALTDVNDPTSLKKLQKTLKILLDQQFLRPVNWWNLMPPDELVSKITLEEEKKLRSGATTSASMTSKVKKEAGKATETRLKAMRHDDRTMEGLKRKASDMISIEDHRAKRQRLHLIFDDDDEEEQENVRFDFDENTTIAIDHKQFAIIKRNTELMFAVHKCHGLPTAKIYKIVLELVQKKLKEARDEMEEISVKTSEIAALLPDISTSAEFLDLVDEQYRPPPALNGTNSPMKRQNRMLNFTSEESDLPEVQLNGADRTAEGNFIRRKEIVRRHLEALAGDESSLIRQSNGTKKVDDTDDEEWSVNLLSLQQFIRIKEIERIVRGKYGSESLRLLRIINQKHHVDQDQFEKLVLLKNSQIRLLLPQLQAGGILEVVEIPKAGGMDRSKNYNLLSFHEGRARTFLLQDLYKTLIKIYQRINEERARKQGIIAKAQRTDVKKDLKRYLSKDELKSYNAWRVLEERLLGQIMRIDKSVMLLRDV